MLRGAIPPWEPALAWPSASSGADSPSAQQRERSQWMDVTRGEMVLLVIMFHSTGLLRYGDVTPPPQIVTLNNLSEPYWMPTLSFLSGMLADSSMDKDAVDYYDGKVRTVLYPFVVWTVVYAAVFRVPPNLDSALQLGTGGTYLFFLAFLFAFNGVSYPLRHIHPAVIAAVALAVAATAPALLPSVPDRFTERAGYLLAMFTLGRWAARDPELWRRLQESRSVLAAAAAATAAGAGATAQGRRVSYRWQWAWSPALAMVLFARSAKAIEHSPSSRPLRFVGRNSIVYYTAHFPVAYGAIRWSRSHAGLSGGRSLSTALAASLAAPTALTWARRRSATARRLFSL
jgi:hypothetical protein